MSNDSQSPALIPSDPKPDAEVKPGAESQDQGEPQQDELPEFGPETALAW